MKKILLLVLHVVFVGYVLVSCTATVDKVEKETYVFSEQDGVLLSLDKYAKPGADELKPCVIFVFGGGFSGGARDHKANVAFLEQLAENGYVAVGIDYRLGMKNVKAEGNPLEMVAKMSNAIQIAVEDLFKATTFVNEHATEWGIDKDLIIACGSSAGAITVLHGEYSICNQNELTALLPEGFRYGGIIAFAGAIFNTTDGLSWATAPSPIQLFHGDADRNVPFGKIAMEPLGMYGSQYIADQLEEMDSPYYFYEYMDTDHSVAGSPMTDNLGEINSFVNSLVINKKQYKIRTLLRDSEKPTIEKNFTIMDYITSNY